MSATKGAAQLDIDFENRVFAVPTHRIRGLVRGESPIESQRGAVDVLGKQTMIQRQILHMLVEEGPLTDRQIESHAIFANLGPSTARKRRVELFQAGLIVKVGRRDKMSLWDIAPSRS